MSQPGTLIWPAVVLTLLASAAGVGFVMRLARRSHMMDHPGQRHSHSRATPTGGGLGMFAALALVSLLPPVEANLPTVWVTAMIPAMLILSCMGWFDDRRPLSPWLRLLVQVVVSIGLLAFLWQRLDQGGGVPPGALNWLLMASLLVGLVWIMNAFNFMDGSDGMAGCQGLFSAAVLGCLFYQAGDPAMAAAAWMLAATCAGFLPWNFPRARVFMGDAGSVSLGFGIGGLLIAGLAAGLISIPVALLVLGVFLIDSSLTLALRILRGERWYTPHKRHVYQRLIKSGWSHGRVLGLYQGINMFIVLPGIALSVRFSGGAWLVTGLVMLGLILGWCTVSLKSGGNT
jgi:Fuc2NAc and GlcNAc transferase